MELYRITRQKYEADMSGEGAALYGSRWNPVGQRMLYTAGSRSLALLETLVHLTRTQPPADYRIVVFYAPDTLPMYVLTDRQLAEGWQTDSAVTQQIGRDWLSDGTTPLLRVPSVIVPAEFNYLINPTHPASADIKRIAIEPISFDSRFFQLS